MNSIDPCIHLYIPAEHVKDVYRILTGDYEVAHKGTVFPLPAAVEVNAAAQQQHNAESAAVAEMVEEKPKRGRKPKVVEVVAITETTTVRDAEGSETTSTTTPAEEIDDAVVEAALASLNSPDPAAEEETWDVEEEAEEVVIPEREWTDADLGALCSRVAGILKGPEKVKEKIGQFVPAGEAVVHSRNIPATDREAFYQELRKLAQAVDPTFEYEG